MLVFYCFYNAQKKDEVFEALKKNVKLNKDSIPAATQLFTPKWIVKYMAENSIGKLALENFNISAETKDKWKYFIDNENPHPSPLPNKEREQVKLEDIKIIDPCMGSGHMLVYSFELLFDIYVDLGWTPREAVLSILQNNIYGLDIDDRAAQLASFALIMTARTKFNRLFKTLENENIIPHTHSIKETNELDIYVEGLIKDNKLNELYYLIDTFKDAKELGSTIKLREINLEKVSEQIERLKALDSIGFPQYESILNDLLDQAKLLASKYDVTIKPSPVQYDYQQGEVSYYLKQKASLKMWVTEGKYDIKA